MAAVRPAPPHDEIALLLRHRAQAREQLDQIGEAERDYREAVRMAERATGPDGRRTTDARLSFAEFLLRRGRSDEAPELLARVERALEATDIGAVDRLRQRYEIARAAGPPLQTPVPPRRR